MNTIERLPTGVPGFDKLLAGGIPRGFFVAVTGEPGCGKTIFALHFAAQGVEGGDKVIYVTTEESRESIVRQAAQFGWDFKKALKDRKLVIIDALLRERGDPWSLIDLTVEELIDKVIEAKRYLGYGRARLVIDSMSAFWLDKPAMARKYSYQVKRVLSRWDFTALLISQYAITTMQAFGWGLEHIADGIIRFTRRMVGGRLRRYVLVEKMWQTPHDLHLWEIDIRPGKGMVLLGKTQLRAEDVSLPEEVYERIARHKEPEEQR